jgi:hypothetical protein
MIMVSLLKSNGVEHVPNDSTAERATFVESVIEGGWTRETIVGMTRNYLGALADIFRGRI